MIHFSAIIVIIIDKWVVVCFMDFIHYNYILSSYVTASVLVYHTQ